MLSPRWLLDCPLTIRDAQTDKMDANKPFFSLTFQFIKHDLFFPLSASSASCVLKFFLFMTGKSPGTLNINVKVDHKQLDQAHELLHLASITGDQGDGYECSTRSESRKAFRASLIASLLHHVSLERIHEDLSSEWAGWAVMVVKNKVRHPL